VSELKNESRGRRPNKAVQQNLVSGLALSVTLWLSGCASPLPQSGDYSRLNSRFSDTAPALSGNGRFLALVTNRGGRQDLALYDIQQQRFLEIPRLNRRNALIESPSLSRSARYIAYVVSERGRPEIAVYDRVTQRRQMLTSGFRGPVRNPSISPDGRYVAFESGRRGQWDIEVFDRGASIPPDLVPGAPAGQGSDQGTDPLNPETTPNAQ